MNLGTKQGQAEAQRIIRVSLTRGWATMPGAAFVRANDKDSPEGTLGGKVSVIEPHRTVRKRGIETSGYYAKLIAAKKLMRSLNDNI